MDKVTNKDNFELLDDIFSDFAKTSILLGKKCNFQEIVQSADLMSSHYKFYNHSIPYLGKVFKFKSFDMEWVNIKLPYNDFHFPKSGEESSSFHHKSNEWIHDEDKCWKYFNKTREILSDNYNECQIFYNYSEKYLDMKFYPSCENNPGIIITF